MNRQKWWLVATGSWALTAGMLIGWHLLDRDDDTASATPGDGSAAVGFARDMSVHHAQAVAMSEIIRQRSADPAIRGLATDIVLTQENQIGRMQSWLELWEVNPTSLDPAMAWMGDAHDPSMMGAGGLMPGMATTDDLAQLEVLVVPDAEIKYLQLMIAHHYAGVMMAEHAMALTDVDVVDRIAESMVEGQYAEIAAMSNMLVARGIQPAPPPPMTMPASGDDAAAHHGS